MFFKMIKEYIESFSITSFYENRAKIVFPLGNKIKIAKDGNDMILDCETNANSIFNKLIQGFSPIASRFSCLNDNCNFQYVYYNHARIVRDYTEVNCTNSVTVHESLLRLLNKKTQACRKCKNNGFYSYSLSSLLIFDFEHCCERAKEMGDLSFYENLLNFLPLHLQIHNKQFILAGAIGFNITKSRSGSYYVAYLRKESGWEVRNDLSSNCTFIPLNSNCRSDWASIVYMLSN